VGVLNAHRDRILFYSVIWRDGISHGLKFVGPQAAKRLFRKLPFNTDGMKELIKQLDIVVSPLECMDELDQDEITTLILRDVANAPAEQKRDFLKRGLEPFLSP
jgi:hypothetical protein